jgi:hypothetical protein
MSTNGPSARREQALACAPEQLRLRTAGTKPLQDSGLSDAGLAADQDQPSAPSGQVIDCAAEHGEAVGPL